MTCAMFATTNKNKQAHKVIFYEDYRDIYPPLEPHISAAI